ncbi:TonB-dependent receptor [Novosphingobium sp. G106]|uniref:TonB-dependent receptor n=1 Tax=Novosphingobium sp. G106 TaxID=2849500 RepID=UPI001C2DE60D|nr:TonB-dependent receptor [Novosphingobium sp. G106]MBV1691080.1 TonB-dependent receptor [Novosphingobium sp. G106]
MKSLTRVALVATTALAWTAPAFAQDAQAGRGEANGNDDIIVTARRSEERLQDVPISITVLSQDAITKRNIVSSVDLGTYVPSLSTNQSFGAEKASFAIRGFTQEGKTSPSVAVYFADVVAPRSNGGTTSGNGAGVGSFMDLQNVQVLKGPQGTLFGRNSTGGAILLVPSKPTDNLEGYVQGSIGDYNMHRVEAVLNAPLSSAIRVRGAIDWNQRDGYLHNKSGIGPDDFGNTNYFAARFSVVADITPDLENYTIGSYSRSNTHGVLQRVSGCNRNYASAFGLVGLLGPFACGQVDRQNARGDGFWDVDNNDPNPQELIRQWQVINTTTLKASDTLTIKNIVSYAEYRETADFDLFGDNLISTGQPLNFGNLGIGVGAAGICSFGSAGCTTPLVLPTVAGQSLPGITLHPGVSGNNSAQSTLTEELQFQGTLADGRFNWQAGAYLESSKPLGFNTGTTQIFESCTDYSTLQCTNPLLIGSLSASNVKDTFNSKAFYAQATYKLTEQLSLTGGFRYTWDKVMSESRNVNINIPTPGTAVYSCQNVVKFNGGDISIPLIVEGPISAKCDDVLHQNSSRPTWLIDVDYKPIDDILLYAKWARGYRQGAINSNNLGLEIATPEKIDTYEAGAKTSFRGAVPGYFNIAGFYNNLTDQQLAVNSVVAPQFQGKVPNAQPIVNAGKSRTWGIEVDASVRPFTGFKFDVGYTYLNTKLIEFTQPPLPIYYSALFPSADVGQSLALSPKNRVTLTGTYTLPLDESVGQVSFGATFTHTDANRGVSPNVAPNYLLPAANLLNLNVDWQSVFGRPIDLSFFMTNVTNQKLVVYPAGTFTTNGQITGQLNQPRMFGFRAKVHFGN